MTSRASSLDAQVLFAGDAARAFAPVGDAELRQLRLFCVVVAAGGLSAATAELQADLSTVSRQFKELETRVGTRLAERGRGGFVLTPAGEQLHRSALRLLASLQAFRDDVAQLGQAPGARLRLGIVDALLTAPGAPLTSALAHCADALPGLVLELLTLRPIEIERRILAGELDAGIVAAHPPAAGLQQQRLYTEPNSLYVAPGHPWFERDDATLVAADLAAIACVVDPYSTDLPHRPAGPLHGTIRADSIEGVALLVASGRFAGFLPDHLVAATAPLATLRRVKPALFSHAQDIVLTCRRGKAEPALRQLLRHCTEAR
ncbi:LysR family transcriptional regulator [Aquincola sp. S2]|uniref:LysR family transcriptional regulator n=1 Tax=Pseudaquabacterium terrae TaxID=2732868 RepID=A0ABX2EE82_9BURK|nr:LysR family transcriptional regulator [Aquabacterium terrae]NRF66908.1 LysR family transcriptional regulator [Aquabacterium terrae]